MQKFHLKFAMTKQVPIKTIGILGGGQLGMFLCIAAKKLKFNVNIFSENENCSAKKFCDKIFVGEFNNFNRIKDFVDCSDIITVETENIPLKVLEFIENRNKLRPSVDIVKIAQNRIKEKNFLNSLDGIKTTDYKEIKNFNDLKNVFKIFNHKLILKSCEFGYDGKNQFKIDNTNLNKFKDFEFKNFIAEKIVNFQKEISVITCRDIHGEIKYFPPVENKHENNILKSSTFPSNVNKNVRDKAIKYALQITSKLNLIGIIAVEMFVKTNDEILINELAPRPHNSGHWSMDCCKNNQFDNLIYAITNNKVKSPEIFSAGKMINIIGHEYSQEINCKEKFKFYDYHKEKVQDKRKMAHYTIMRNFSS